MDLRLEEVLLVGAGTAPTVDPGDPGATVPSTVAALEGCSGACWLFLCLVLCSSEASRSFFSPLLRLWASSCLQRGRSWARSSHPSTSMSRAFMSFLHTNQNWISFIGSQPIRFEPLANEIWD